MIRPFLLLLPLLGHACVTFAAPKTANIFRLAEDALEARWSYHAQISAPGQGSASWLLGQKTLVLSAKGQALGGKIVQGSRVLATFDVPSRSGELALIRTHRTLRVLWSGQLRAQIETDLGGTKFGTRTSGNWKISGAQMQPTEAVVFRDDFMRADGPDSPEVPDEWRVAGVWKTSGTLGPRADSSLSPNPFVFRASGAGTHIARAGKWFWNDYSLSASVRAVAQNGDNSPLVAALESFSDGKNGGLRGEVNFQTGVARLLLNGRVLAQSAPFDASVGEWHRMRLETQNGVARLIFDRGEVVRAKCNLAQGGVVLRAQTGARNFVDFDDVRVGSELEQLGEGQLPARLVKDRLMRNWASNASAWKRDERGVWWHTGDFWQNANLQVPLPPLRKDGDGFRFFVGANTQNPPSAALAASVTRKDGRIEARLNGTQVATLPLQNGAQNTLLLSLRASFKGNEDVLSWNGKALFRVPARSRAGTKIGIEPTHNGLPLPVPPLQTLTLAATTFERDNHSVIGVNITPVSPQIARDMGLPDATGAVIDNVEEGSPAQEAGFQNGDVVRAANGARVLDVDTMRSAVGAVRAPGAVSLQILRLPPDGSGLNWADCRATTPNQLDYAFTSAPVDWKAARGRWEVAERWTCSPQWSFFAGQNDEFPLLWSRFALRGDWTLEAYLATPMDLTRGERSPMDLNVSVGDGKNISNGYSFAFAAQNREKNVVWRADQIAWQKPFELPGGSGETHQDWFYVRLERRQTLLGVRFKWSLNGQVIGEYEDLNEIKGANRLAFWTKNGALSIARVRLWHNGLRPFSPEPRPMLSAPGTDTGDFMPRGEGHEVSALVSKVQHENAPAVQVENPRSGGDWTLYATRAPFIASGSRRTLSFSYRATPDVKVNLYALVANSWREIAWTGGKARPEDNQPTLGAIAGVQSDGKWHTARFDLAAALEKSGLNGQKIEALAFSSPSREYLRQGLGGNARGATYWLRDWKMSG